MAVSVLGSITVHDVLTANPGFTVATHAVTSGTDTLLALWLTRQHTANVGTVYTGTWNANALTQIRTNYPRPGLNQIVHWVGAINSPTSGTHNFVFDAAGTQQRGGTLVLINLDGCDTANLMGAVASQAAAASATDTVSLSIVPETAGNLCLVFFAINVATTLVSFTGTSFTAISADGQTTVTNALTRTIRYRLGATGTISPSAQFVSSDDEIGGLLMEIRGAAASTLTDALTFDTTPSIGADEGVASQGFAPAAPWWNGQATWTSTLIYQANDVSITRQIMRIGSGTDTRFFLRRAATGASGGAADVLVAEYALSDGTVRAESFAAAQTTDTSVLSIAQRPGDGGRLLIDDVTEPSSFVSGAALSGGINLGSLPVEVGRHTAGTTPRQFSGKIARWIVDLRSWNLQHHRLLMRALTTPHLLWGQGATNTAGEANRSPLALPITRSMTGAGTLVIDPVMIDPDGTIPSLIATTTPINGGTVQIANDAMEYQPASGFVGRDQFSYTVSDGQKISISWVAIDVDITTVSLVASPDVITVKYGEFAQFDPKANDAGPPGFQVIEVTQPPAGMGSVIILGDNRLRYDAPPPP